MQGNISCMHEVPLGSMSRRRAASIFMRHMHMHILTERSMHVLTAGSGGRACRQCEGVIRYRPYTCITHAHVDRACMIACHAVTYRPVTARGRGGLGDCISLCNSC